MPPTSRRTTSPNRRARNAFFFRLGLLRLHEESLRDPRYLLRCHLPTCGPVLRPQGQLAGPCVRARLQDKVQSRAPIGARLRCRGPGADVQIIHVRSMVPAIPAAALSVRPHFRMQSMTKLPPTAQLLLLALRNWSRQHLRRRSLPARDCNWYGLPAACRAV